MADHDPSLWEGFAATVIVSWNDVGLPRTLAGPRAGPLPAPVLHVVTAWDPDGRATDPAANAEAHRHLIAEVEAARWDWTPAVGASPDGSHHEISVAVTGVDLTDVIALGAAHGQLAVFELTEPRLRVVACRSNRTVERPRSPLGAAHDLTYEHLITWRDEHEAITGQPLGRLRCPTCGVSDPRQVAYGMPASMPPDWIKLGGCIIGFDAPRFRCRACATGW